MWTASKTEKHNPIHAAGVWSFRVKFAIRFYIAQEIDMPFGEDSNDLPVELLQHQFNENLLHLSSLLGLLGLDFWSLSVFQHLQEPVLYLAQLCQCEGGHAHQCHEYDTSQLKSFQGGMGDAVLLPLDPLA